MSKKVPLKSHLYEGLKEIDLIRVILKESKSWEEKKKEKSLDTLRKRYVRAANTKHASKTNP